VYQVSVGANIFTSKQKF